MLNIHQTNEAADLFYNFQILSVIIKKLYLLVESGLYKLGIKKMRIVAKTTVHILLISKKLFDEYERGASDSGIITSQQITVGIVNPDLAGGAEGAGIGYKNFLAGGVKCQSIGRTGNQQ